MKQETRAFLKKVLASDDALTTAGLSCLEQAVDQIAADEERYRSYRALADLAVLDPLGVFAKIPGDLHCSGGRWTCRLDLDDIHGGIFGAGDTPADAIRDAANTLAGSNSIRPYFF